MSSFASWNRVVFVDKSHFCSSKLGAERVLRPQSFRFDDRYVNFIEFAGRKAVSVFGMPTAYGLGPLIRIDGRMNAEQYCEVLGSCLPFLRLRFPHDDY